MMELGLTFPLQRFLRRQPPPYGDAAGLGRCWDLHVISLGDSTACWPCTV